MDHEAMPAFVTIPFRICVGQQGNLFGHKLNCPRLNQSRSATKIFFTATDNQLLRSLKEGELSYASSKNQFQSALSKEAPSTANGTDSSQPNGFRLHSGSVVEVWVSGKLKFAYVESTYDKGVIVRFVEAEATENGLSEPTRVSYGEVISVWDDTIVPTGSDVAMQLVRDVQRGIQFVKHSAPRALDLKDVYTTLHSFPKKDSRSTQSAFQISSTLFPMRTKGTRERLATITVATALLLSIDTIRFKRAGPGLGWRALPSSITVSRSRSAFVDVCKSILQSTSRKKTHIWARDHLEILRDIEIIAASGTAAKGTAAIILRELGYEQTDNGAARLLLDIEYWTTGSIERNGVTKQHKRETRISRNGDWTETTEENGISSKSWSREKQTNSFNKSGTNKTKVTDWTFPPELLAEARELRRVTREKRTAMKHNTQLSTNRRLLKPEGDEHQLRIYCVDDKNTQFLDDAISIQFTSNSSIVRIATHITDVDDVVRYGSPIDTLAKERGQSLYLPLKPLHMLPAAVMDAASFSAAYPTNAITVMIDFDRDQEVIVDWEVFASVVPSIIRLSYTQFDAALANDFKTADLNEEICKDLREIARIAPLLAEKLDQRNARRKQKIGGTRLENNDENGEVKTVAGVRLIKRTDKSSPGRSFRVAQVLDFQTTGAHSTIAHLLTSAGALFRQFARENRAFLPENRGASNYVARCGTAPLRRYSDLAIQRQIKCVLFGRQPAGRRRMDELRVWLAKRHAAGEKTLSEKRKSALYDSFSNHCAQQRDAAGAQHAVVAAVVRNVTITRKGVFRVVVTLDGTGLTTTAAVSDQIYSRIEDMAKNSVDLLSDNSESLQSSKATREILLLCGQKLLKVWTKIRVEITNVDTLQYNIDANIVQIVD